MDFLLFQSTLESLDVVHFETIVAAIERVDGMFHAEGEIYVSPRKVKLDCPSVKKSTAPPRKPPSIEALLFICKLCAAHIEFVRS